MIRIISTIVFILSALIIIFYISIPYYGNNLQVNFSQLEAEENKLESRKEYIANINRLHEEFLAFNEEREKLYASLPFDHFVPTLFLTIEEIGAKNGVLIEDLGSFSIMENIDIPETRIIEFSFKISGNYSAIKDFISKLENLSRITEITMMEINYDEEREINPFEVQLNLKSYSY